MCEREICKLQPIHLELIVDLKSSRKRLKYLTTDESWGSGHMLVDIPYNHSMYTIKYIKIRYVV